MVLHEDVCTGGIAGEISAIINEEAFDSLDGPIVRLTALDTPVPFSPPQEEYFLPKTQRRGAGSTEVAGILTPPGTARKARENLGNVAAEQAGLAPTPVSFIMSFRRQCH